MTAKGLTRVDSLLRDKIEGVREVPGAVLLVRGPDGLILREAYGLRKRVPAESPMTRETLFDLASLTKPVCASLLTMIMVQRGSMGLDQDLETWFSPVKDPGKRRITVRQLLSNRSGLPGWRPFYQEYPMDRQPISMDVLSQRILEEPLEEPPGKQEVYSDLGFLLLGSILERASGRPLDRLFQEEIARPLGLSRIGYRRVQEEPGTTEGEEEDIAATEDCPWRRRVLLGEVHDENCFLVGGVGGHAGLFSSAADLDRIVAEIFQGLGNRSGLFAAEYLKTFFQRQGAPSAGTWALGWDTPSDKGSASGRHYSKNSVGHNGFTGTSLWMDCDRNVSIIFLTNRVHPSRENPAIRALRPQVHDAVFEALRADRE
jgi:CubicO group peptidase (beta-lactamase class C family)